jgi:hypothetical protein
VYLSEQIGTRSQYAIKMSIRFLSQLYKNYLLTNMYCNIFNNSFLKCLLRAQSVRTSLVIGSFDLTGRALAHIIKFPEATTARHRLRHVSKNHYQQSNGTYRLTPWKHYTCPSHLPTKSRFTYMELI